MTHNSQTGGVLAAPEATATDEELVEALISTGVLGVVVESGTYDTKAAARVSGIKENSVRTLMTKSPIFPRPVITERRYTRAQIHAYATARQKRPGHTTGPRDSGP